MRTRRLIRDPDVFAIDLCGPLELPPDVGFLVYSPLTCQAFLSDRNGVEKLSVATTRDSSAAAELRPLLDAVTAWRRCEKTSVGPVVDTLSILPTAACNFSCSYCYAKDSHGRKTLSVRQIERTIDAFLDRVGNSRPRLSVSVMGGGEPTLFAELAQILAYVRRCERERAIRIDIQLVTNGSLLSEELIGVLLQARVTVVFSFEILERVQTAQRGAYARVRENLLAFLAAGGSAIIRATITSANVDLQREMVEEVLSTYPRVRSVVFEPVLDATTFDTAAKLSDFLDRFARNFAEARAPAAREGLLVGTSLLRRVDAASRRYCNPEWSLTPEGRLSVCHRLSDGGDCEVGESVFGSVSADGSVTWSEALFEKIVREDFNDREDCRACFARWNCAGGCRCQNRLFSPALSAVRCDFTRRFVLSELLRRLEISVCGEDRGLTGLRELLRAEIEHDD